MKKKTEKRQKSRARLAHDGDCNYFPLLYFRFFNFTKNFTLACEKNFHFAIAGKNWEYKKPPFLYSTQSVYFNYKLKTQNPQYAFIQRQSLLLQRRLQASM